MKYLILDRDTNQIIHRYEADKLTPHGGPASNGLHVQIPDELELRTATVELSEEAPVIYEEYVRVLVDIPQEQSEFGMELPPIQEEQIQPSIILKGIISGENDNSAIDLRENKWTELRAKRDSYLKETDWTQLGDTSLSLELKKQYRDYRSYLRVLPTLHNDSSIMSAKVCTFAEWCNGER